MTKKVVEMSGEAKIGRLDIPPMVLELSPDDLTSPISFQMALSRLVDKIMDTLENPPEPHYFAEVRIRDHLNRPVSIAIDLGKSIPPFSKDKVKARVIIEIYEEEEEEE